VGARPGRGAYCGLPGRAPWGRGNCLAAQEAREGTREHMGDAATTYGGDALPPRPGALGHSPREPVGSELPPALLGVVARDQRWEKKRSSPEPSRRGHWDLDAVKEEIRRVTRV
jgi:hypothetical protein